MPKRRNPFGDSSPLQFKTHVGQKELNEGVDGERSLKGIYEKTKQILFSGAQRSASDMVTDANDNHVVFTPVGSPVRRCTQLPPLPGQLCLNQSGQLTVPTRDVDMDAAPISENSWNFLKGNPHCHLYNECSPPHNVHQMAPLPGQLRLDQSGQLMVPTTSSKDVDMVAVPSLQETWNKVKGKGKQPLKKFPLQEKCRCSFCDKWIDRRSIRQCTNCDEDFCELCSTVNYDECMERIFCLGCNS